MRSYEVQIKAAYRAAGLGHFLMQSLECLGKTQKMKKVMLTVFKGQLLCNLHTLRLTGRSANEAARQFYDRIGYRIDEICPSQYDLDEGEPVPDYEILSKQTLH